MKFSLSKLLTPPQHAWAILLTLLAANVAAIGMLVEAMAGRIPLLSCAAMVVCFIVGVTLMVIDTKPVPGSNLGGE